MLQGTPARHSQTQLQQLTLGLLCVLQETLGFLPTLPKVIVRGFLSELKPQ